ncbi:transglycosylase SLT domain-containing protein [Caldimonas tepidiphila]|uniref:lytic transglycosylase domain-containing protein n=1 Tax=Caldimonas tepidiphila TaxID=2315841 RepID=UPI00196B1620|nr:lytic transglycosylase domain-containing protein [Caldimonas tepidiphila]
MTAFRSLVRGAHEARVSAQSAIEVFVTDVVQGLVEISHNTLALLGLAVVAVTLFAAGRPDLRESFEAKALGWLQARQEARAEGTDAALVTPVLAEPDAIARATAADPRELSKQQSAVALWLSRRYRVAPEPLARLVKEAWEVGSRTQLDPTLILAIMAVESSFNPFAQSSVGAQGLMQVMTRVHDDKYEAFGGTHAAFDPVTNLRVGVQVLRECIKRAGSIEGGLRYYVGAANLEQDGGYTSKVLAEQGHLQRVAQGRSVPVTAPLPRFVAPQRSVPANEETVAAVDPAVEPTVVR